MRRKRELSVWGVVLLSGLVTIITSCDFQKSVGIQESLQSISDLTLIEGAESSSAIVNKSSESYFTLDIGNIEANNFVKSGEHNSWCIAWNKPIASSNSQHNGLKLYSTYQDQNWKPINYLLNIRPYLQLQDPDLTYREIQVAIWSLLDFPEFDLDKLSIDDIPSRMVSNGHYNFNREKVDQIVNIVRKNYNSFNYSSATTFAVIVETPSNTQTVIIEADETVWAYGQHSFRSQELREQLGITGMGKGQWGWIFELEGNHATTELIAGGGDDDGTKAANEVGTIVGSLEIDRSGDNLEVTYSVTNDYLVSDLHLWVGCSLEEFPWVGNTGNVAPGGFPYHYNDGPTDSYTFSVDLSSYSCSGNIFIAAHAGDLYKTEEIQLPDDPIQEPVFTMTDLSQFGLSSAVDINDHGHIVSGQNYWNSDTKTLTNTGIFAIAMNNHGEVISRNHYWDKNNGVIEIDTLNYTGILYSDIYVEDINDNGVVVGEVDFIYCFLSTDECPDDWFYEFWSMEWDLESRTTNEIRFSSIAKSVNNSDQVTGVGYFDDPHEIYVSSTSFGPYTGFSSGEPYAINNHGQVVGSIQTQISSSNNLLSLKQSQDPLKDLSNIKKFQRLTTSRGTFDTGHVIEMLQNSTFDSEIQKFGESEKTFSMSKQYNPEMLHIWDKEEQLQIIETALNTTYQSEAFFWDEETGIKSLGTLGGNWSTAFDINDHGQVVGYSSTGDGGHRAFYWDEENGMIELPTNGENSIARAINNSGQIVGSNNGPVMWEVTFETQELAISNSF